MNTSHMVVGGFVIALVYLIIYLNKQGLTALPPALKRPTAPRGGAGFSYLYDLAFSR
jgi:hypothetical protein